ncbi:MAG: hypothetical protein ACI4I6_06535 [Hominimerdicola sp.]
MNDFYNEIIDKLGERNQLTKCVEELSELQQVLCKLISADDGVNKDKAIEEIADVKIVRTAKRYLRGEKE